MKLEIIIFIFLCFGSFSFGAEVRSTRYGTDAKKALLDLKNVKCEDFDCPASENFESVISVK